VATGAPQMSPI